MTAQVDWKVMAGGLATVRDVVRKQRVGCTRSVERAALAKVADHAAFEGLGPTADRGRWIVARVRQRLLELERDSGGSPAGRAVRCWARYVDDGLSPVELHGAYPELIVNEVPAVTDVARRNRVQSLMWAGGARGDKDSFPGVQKLRAELRTALSTGLPDGTRMDAVTFGYEWSRLAVVLPAGRDLLQVLARLAPEAPFSQGLLREGGDCLPGLAAEICASAAPLRDTCAALRARGLLETEGDLITVRDGTATHVLSQLPSGEALQWTGAVLRFLTHALRADTHSQDSWAEWDIGFPHVLAACEAAERDQIQLGDVAYALDRASVYARECLEDAELAIELSERAVVVAREGDDPELISDCLGNLGMAYRKTNRFEDAVKVSAESVEQIAAAFGVKHELYGEGLNVHANLLAASNHVAEALKAHAQSVKVLRAVCARNPGTMQRGLLAEALNDYAAAMVSSGGSAVRIRKLLNEASACVQPGDHGWIQIELNLAGACRAGGDLPMARDRLQTVCDHCKAHGHFDPSNTLVTVLMELAEVYDELGDPRAAETLREAHRMDNALIAKVGGPQRLARSS